MKCYLSIPGLFAFSGNPSNLHTTKFSTHGKDTAYVSAHLCRRLPPRVCGMTIPCVLSMQWRSDDAVIAAPHSLKLSLVFFRYQNVTPSPVVILLYSAVPCCTQMKTGVYTIDLVILRFVRSPTLSDILTTAVRIIWTQMGLHTSMW